MSSSSNNFSMLVDFAATDSGLDSTTDVSMEMDCNEELTGIPKVEPSATDEKENIVHFDAVDDKEIQKQKRMEKELERLQAKNPGKGYVPSPRRLRPKRGPQKTRIYHDKKGTLHVDKETMELCDCLNAACPGCFSPCNDCNGRKCAVICQKNRDGYCVSVRTIGMPVVYNPFVQINPQSDM